MYMHATENEAELDKMNTSTPNSLVINTEREGSLNVCGNWPTVTLSFHNYSKMFNIMEK